MCHAYQLHRLMIQRRDTLRHKHNTIKTQLKKANEYRVQMKNASAKTKLPPIPDFLIGELNMIEPQDNVKVPASTGILPKNVMKVPKGIDPNASRDASLGGDESTISVNVNVASTDTAVTGVAIDPTAGTGVAIDPTVLFSDIVNIPAVQTFINLAYVLGSEGLDTDVIARKTPAVLSSGEIQNSEFICAAERHCVAIADNPTLRPLYSDINPVNVRSRVLRSNPKFTDHFSHDNYNSKG